MIWLNVVFIGHIVTQEQHQPAEFVQILEAINQIADEPLFETINQVLNYIDLAESRNDGVDWYYRLFVTIFPEKTT